MEQGTIYFLSLFQFVSRMLLSIHDFSNKLERSLYYVPQMLHETFFLNNLLVI